MTSTSFPAHADRSAPMTSGSRRTTALPASLSPTQGIPDSPAQFAVP